ncbi:phosphatidate cytidylyltransferase [Corynebacterium mendelii]|uniref:Phosphatidate cytidylyltransferase n=1 Tax=Corynebacterium mendelii TaxID=2765362 RepID=A0A939DYJ7_9CORY|nr:phosphatidate cytidylyltransferase [Corynebacterium mendelii]MBN9643211.1 phosphatidate cytidylyltransferase [Corynebacterium mendelii]
MQRHASSSPSPEPGGHTGDAVNRSRREQLIESLPKPRNSAGRDLKSAVITGVSLGALVLVCIFLIPTPYGWYPFVAVAIALGSFETLSRLKEAGYILPFPVVLVGGQLMLWTSWPFGTKGLVSSFVATVLVLMFGRLFHHGRSSAPMNYMRDTAIGIFVLAWIPLFGTFAAMLALISRDGVPGTLFIITFIVCVIANDVGGYIAGVLFGKHPMAPAVSPKKSLEGFAGSVVAGVVAGALMSHWLLNDFWWRGAIMGLGLVICATLGDLVESQFKRELGIKDMSAMLPGHGGIMDRVDGMLPAAMVTWLFMSVMSMSVA